VSIFFAKYCNSLEIKVVGADSKVFFWFLRRYYSNTSLTIFLLDYICVKAVPCHHFGYKLSLGRYYSNDPITNLSLLGYEFEAK